MMRQKQVQVTYRRTRLTRTENLFPKLSSHSSRVSHSFHIISRSRLLSASIVSLGVWGREQQTVLIHSLQEPDATFLIFLPLLFGNGREKEKFSQSHLDLDKWLIRLISKHQSTGSSFLCFSRAASLQSDQPESPFQLLQDMLQ